ncbi:hypothetical protein [Planctobacterium marinum]|uniref:hypothetical protein n=1 Tax=Planctobacterium marinum TaxID=1631968 RepID=UPI001E43EEA8|nr:hypothetical protein [Planctobacterium marinum]MCC2604451.1 hypothetical protein [Planctobacterium marinum]
MKKLAVLIPFLIFVLTACEKIKSSGEQVNNTADMSALIFFDSIYNKNDFRTALNHASPRMQRLMKSYHTSTNVARHIINLRYDGEVYMEIDAGDSVGRLEYATKQNVSIFFTGNYQGNVIDELRTVKMVKEDGKWVVDSIMADKFR